MMLACPFCGAGSGLALLLLIVGVFVLMFAGTILLFLSSWGRGEWRDRDARWLAVRAEKDESR